MSPSESAELFYFEPPTLPLEPGSRRFTLTLDAIGVHEGAPEGATLDPAATGAIEVEDPWRMVNGPWVFEFDLDVAGGTFLEPDTRSAAVGGATIGVESMLVTPTRLRLGLRVEGLDDAGAWELVGVTAERESTTIPFGNSLPTGDGLTYAGALEGLDDPAGTWTITIGELVGPALGPVPTPRIDGAFEDHSQRTLGPWVVEVVVP